MYKVLIVDDEAPARELLKMKVDWKSINCEVSALAKNGQEALDIYQEIMPDLIITDIQMPVMDGLALITAVKAINPNQSIIILSCHESFDFARKAIKLGVDDYLLKDSFETEELYTIITDLLKNTASNSSNVNLYPTLLEQEKSTYTKHLLKGKLPSEEVGNYISQHKLNILNGPYLLQLIDLEVLNQDVSKPESQFVLTNDIQVMNNIIKSSMTTFVVGESCHYSHNYFAIIYSPSNSHSQLEIRKEAIQIANLIRQQLEDHFQVQVTIGISNLFNQLDQIPLAMEESLSSTKRKIISGYGKTHLSSGHTRNDDDQYIKILNVKLKRVESYLVDHQFDAITKEIKDIYLVNLKGFMQYNYLKHTNWTLLSMFIDFCSKNSLSFMTLSGSRSPWESILELKTVDDMCHWFLSAIGKINDQLTNTTDENYSYHVSKCIKYIHRHYNENINLMDLAEKYDINNAYLSRLFKKETGISLTDYINNIRIEEAKTLIQNTSYKMYEIADKCGFSSTQRFFLTFKKVVGVSPGDFRNT